MKETVLIFGCVFGGLAVTLGGFVKHVIKRDISSRLLSSFETGVRYQMYHALVLLIIGYEIPLRSLNTNLMAWFFIIGTFFFSFSIYGLCISAAKGNKISSLGPVTPIGGLFLIAGWVMLTLTIINLNT